MKAKLTLRSRTRTRTTTGPQPSADMPQVEMILFLILIIGMCAGSTTLDPASKVVSDRYAVFWNRTNPK